MERDEILEIINVVLTKKGREPASDSETPLADAGIRSLDFSEIAMRLEVSIGDELNFEASTMRRIATVKDVIDFLLIASGTDVHTA